MNQNLSNSNLFGTSHLRLVEQKNLLKEFALNYLPLIILVQGLACNLTTLVVFYKLSQLGLLTKVNRKTSIESGKLKSTSPIYLYLFVLALFDLGVLVFGLFNEALYHLLQIDLKHYTNMACKSLTFLAYLFSHCSSCTMVIIVWIRYLFIIKPTRALKLFSFKSFKKIITAQLVLLGLIDLHLFYNMRLVKLNESFYLVNPLNISKKYDNFIKLNDWDQNDMPSQENYECDIRDNVFNQKIWPIIDKLIYCVVPFLLVSFFNVFIIKSVQSSSSKSSTINEEKNFLRQDSTVFYNKSSDLIKLSKQSQLSSKMLIDLNEIYVTAMQTRTNQIMARKYTYLLVGISVIFLGFTLPVVLIYVFIHPIKRSIELSESIADYELFIMFQKLASSLMYMNHSLKFFVYLFVSAKFRKKLKIFKKNTSSLLSKTIKIE